jgi:hypothetical protein
VNATNRQRDRDMNSLKPEIIHLYKQREQHQTWLLSHGVLQEDINKILVQSSQVLGAFWSPSLIFLGKNEMLEE